MSGGSIRFATDWQPWWVASVVVAAVIVVVLLYLRETRSLGSPYGWLLPGLRGAAVALVVLTLAAPVWHRRQVFGTLGHVTFAVDDSRSMSLDDPPADGDGDGSSPPSRLQRATSLLAGSDGQPGWIERLRETHELEIVVFSTGDPRSVWTTAADADPPRFGQLTAAGETTDLSAALGRPSAVDAEPSPDAASDREPETSSERATASPPAARGTGDDSAAGPSDGSDSSGEPRRGDPRRRAIVLMTDGRDTAGGSATEAARRASDSATVHAVGLGNDDEPDDLGILGVRYPENVAADGRLAGEIRLKHFGYVGSTARVRVEAFDETVWEQTVAVDADGNQTVPFELEVSPLIAMRLGGDSGRVRRDAVVLPMRAVVDPVGGELTEANNVAEFRVAASTRQRRLLILDGSSRWEIRYLRNLFERDPRWDVDTVLFGAGTDMPTARWGDEPGEIPETREGLARYDAIVVGEVPADQLDDAATFRFRDFVTRGGGLVLIDGRYGRFAALSETGLGELIPVRTIGVGERPEVRYLQPTPTGREQAVLQLGGDTQDDVSGQWRRLPPPVAVAPLTAKEDAEVWVEAIGVDGRRHPWLVTRLYGSGRVVYLGSGESWRWRYKAADRIHARFWNQLVNAVMQPPYAASDAFVAIGTDRIDYRPGERAMVRVRVQDTAGEPVGDATVDALIVADGQTIAAVPLNVDDPARGTYQGMTPPLERGEYQVRVRVSGFDTAALQASTPIWVSPRGAGEFDRVSLDRETLRQIADAGQGVFVHESDADRLLESLAPLSTGRVVESDYLLWQSYPWFLAILSLLTLEWWLRKRAGLA